MKKLIIAEKPSQRKEIEKALGDGNYIYTNAIGHLFELKKTNETWNEENLPIYLNDNIISNYTLKKDTQDQFNIVKKNLNKDIDEIICATDPDAEGEIIFRTIVEHLNIQNIKMSRLIIKDLTPTGLRQQFTIREDIKKYEGLRERGYARAFTDYLFGVNFTQALTLKSGIKSNVGRVQSPTLKFIVDRYNENKNHVKSYKYKCQIAYDGYIFNTKEEYETKSQAEVDKQRLINYLENKPDLQENSKLSKLSPPKLYDLTDIQKWSNRKLNLSTSETLKIVQSLYEKGYVTYPRTDSKFITEDTKSKLEQEYQDYTLVDILNNSIKKNEELNKQVVGKVETHEGLTPTGKSINKEQLNQNELAIYDEIEKVFLSNFLNEATIEKKVLNIDGIEEYTNTSKKINIEGYLNLYKNFKEKDFDKTDDKTFKIDILEIESKPKPLFTESTLLSKMQNIHLDIEDEELRELSKETQGIGTPATRSGIIKSLFDNELITEEKNKIIPTKKGITLINNLMLTNSALLNIDFTAKLEQDLKNVERNKSFDVYYSKIKEYTKEIVHDILESDIEKQNSSQNIFIGKCPKCNSDIIKIRTKTNKNWFTCSNKGCDFNFPVYTNVTQNDIKKLLMGEKSSPKSKVSKAGKNYKIVYYINKNNKLEQEFYNKVT